MLIHSLADTATTATETFRTYKEGKPVLIPTGIKGIDNQIGGLGPGSTMIIGGRQGLGKSSVALDAILENQRNGHKWAYISLEDTPDVFGCRLLARYSGVDSRLIRSKELSGFDLEDIREGHRELEADSQKPHAMVVYYCVGSPLPEVVEAVEDAKEKGCVGVVIDYVQKVRGLRDDRRNEVAMVFTELHHAAFNNDLACIFLSQISRQMDPNRMPTAAALKETGDLENEARVILMLGRLDGDRDKLYGILDKSTFGGEGTRVQWYRDTCGTLKQGMK